MGGFSTPLNILTLNKLAMKGQEIREMQPYVVNYVDKERGSESCHAFIYTDGKFFPQGNGPLDDVLPIIDITDDIYLRDNSNPFYVVKVRDLV